MRVGGKALGAALIVLALAIAVFATGYTQQLKDQRDAAVTQLMSLPEYENCAYDESGLCPHAEETIVLPDITGIGILLVLLLLGVYLFRSDQTQRGILSALDSKQESLEGDIRRKLVFSVLTKDERKVVEEIERQDGISQATLRLRTDFSKAKLSMLLKELERRGLVQKKIHGKTNRVHLKRVW